MILWFNKLLSCYNIIINILRKIKTNSLILIFCNKTLLVELLFIKLFLIFIKIIL